MTRCRPPTSPIDTRTAPGTSAARSIVRSMDPPTVGGASRYRRASTINVTGMADEWLSIEPDRRARHTAIKVGPTVLALAAVGVLVLIGRRNAADLSHVHLRLRPAWLALAVPLYAA